MKAMSKTIFEFQLFALSVVLAASIQLGKNVNVVSCARRLNVEEATFKCSNWFNFHGN